VFKKYPENIQMDVKKPAPYGTDSRLFTTDVSANFKVTWHKK